jgi:hypothetical protein
MKHIRILILKNRKGMEIFDRNPCDTISYEVHECRKLHNTWIHGLPSSTSTASIKLRNLQRTVHVTCLGKHEKRIKVSWGKLYGKRLLKLFIVRCSQVVMEIISQREALLFEVYMYNCQFKDGS